VNPDTPALLAHERHQSRIQGMRFCTRCRRTWEHVFMNKKIVLVYWEEIRGYGLDEKDCEECE